MKTYSPKATDLRAQWHVVDAAQQPLGRVAVRIATLLRGKHKPIFSSHINTGDFVIVINARHVRITGKKRANKTYYRHSQYPGGLSSTTFDEMIEKHPTRVLRQAVWGMLPHNPLGRQMLRRLKLYPDSEHPHEAQVKGSEKWAAQMEENPIWIGLPKPLIRRRKKKKTPAQTKPVSEPGQATEAIQAPALEGEAASAPTLDSAETAQSAAESSPVESTNTAEAVEQKASSQVVEPTEEEKKESPETIPTASKKKPSPPEEEAQERKS